MVITEDPSEVPDHGVSSKDSTSPNIAATPFGITVIAVISAMIAIIAVIAIKQKGESTKKHPVLFFSRPVYIRT